MKLRSILFLSAFAASSACLAADYYVVVPVPAKTVSKDAVRVSLASSGLPSGVVSYPYAGYDLKKLLSVTGDGSFTGYGVKWTVVAGQLPAGLSLSADGSLSGTPTSAGTYAFTVQASYKSVTGEQVYQLVTSAITVSLGAVVPYQASEQTPFAYDYSDALAVSGDSEFSKGAVTWALASGALPPGVALDSRTGVVYGTPTAAGTFSFSLRATYRNSAGVQDYKVVVGAIAVSLTSGVLPAATEHTPYAADLSAKLAVTGDAAYVPGTGVSWAVVGGSLPEGLSLDASSGVISGVPSSVGSYNVTVRATYRTKNGQQVYQVIVGGISVELSAATLNNVFSGDAYSYDFKSKLSVTGDAAYVAGAGVLWEVAAGALPPGLSLNASTGVVSGTAGEAGAYEFTLRATYKTKTGQQAYQLVVGNITVSLAAATLNSVFSGDAYSQDFKPRLTVTGDAAYVPGTGVTWSVASGSLPTGLSLNTSTGVVSGTPTAAGTFNFTLQASYKTKTGQQTYQQVVSTIVVTLAAGAAPVATEQTAYAYDFSQKLSVTGDAGYEVGTGVTWSVVSGALPSGLVLNTSTGVVYGTPTSSGTANFVLQASYKTKTGQQSYQIVVSAITVALESYDIPPAIEQTDYSFDFHSRLSLTGDPTYGSGGLDVTWSIVSGSLPAGISLNPVTGVISGRPTSPGATQFTIQASYKTKSGQRAYTFNASAIVLSLEGTAIPPAVIQSAYSYNFNSRLNLTGDSTYGGPQGTNVAWSIVNGALPPGLSYDGATGAVSGTPTSGGSFFFTLQANYKTKVAQKVYQQDVTADYRYLMNGFTRPAVHVVPPAAWAQDGMWFWDAPNAAGGGIDPPPGTRTFRKQVFINGLAPVATELFGATDDSLDSVRINGVSTPVLVVEDFGTRRVLASFVMQPGYNVVEATITNGNAFNNPAGFTFLLRRADNGEDLSCGYGCWYFQ